MRRSVLVFLILVIFCVTLALSACGGTTNTVDVEAIRQKAYDDGYYEGHSDGYMEREDEFDDWWEDKYYSHELVEIEEVRAYAKFAYVIGLLHGYEARNEHRQLIPFQGAKTEEEKEDAYYNLVGYFCPGEYYYDDIEEIAKEVYPAIFK